MAERGYRAAAAAGRRFFPAAGHYRLADGLVKDALRAPLRGPMPRS